MTADGELIGGRYRLGEPLGRGRRGFVWLAHDEHLQRTVAARPVRLPRAETPAAGQRARTLALLQANQATRIKHPGIVTVYQVVPASDDIWLITEYVPSRPLSEFLSRNGKLTPKQTASLGGQLASALLAAQKRGLLHRSIEPANVLFADDGDVQLTDFGIGPVVPETGYQAPEVLRGQEATSASDVFSLGATLFMAVEGRPPFGPSGTDAPTVGQGAGDGLSEVLERMLAIDPRARPTMKGAEEALSALARGQRPAPESLRAPAPPVPVARPVPPVTRRPPPAEGRHPGHPEPAGRRPEHPESAGHHPGRVEPTERTPLPAFATAGAAQAASGGPANRYLSTVLAVLAAAALGILFTELFLI